jgi:hypothetical protein
MRRESRQGIPGEKQEGADMRRNIFILLGGVLIFIASIIVAQGENTNFPLLKGPYLDQPPPGKKPELFAPEIFASELHGGLVFSPDGKEIYWDLMQEGRNILYMSMENGHWTPPKEVPFRSKFGTGDATFSPDGKKLFFTSQESIEGGKKEAEENIWFVERQNGGWGKPKSLGSVVNSYPIHWQLSVAGNGNLYFGVEGDIFIAKSQTGEYPKVDRLSGSINTEHHESTPFISPDESYIIFSRYGGALRFADLFISFRDANGNWTNAKNMGPTINSNMHELCPNVTPDGRYLFFNRNHGAKGDLRVFWVEAGIIDELRPDEMK